MRLAQLTNKSPVLYRQSRFNYGVVFDEPYELPKPGNLQYPGFQQGSSPEPYVNPADGRRYVQNRIRWILEAGAPIDGKPSCPSSKPAKRSGRMKLFPGRLRL